MCLTYFNFELSLISSLKNQQKFIILSHPPTFVTSFSVYNPSILNERATKKSRDR